MKLYFFTPQALSDLEEIYDFIAEDNTHAALRFIDLIEEKIQALAEYPNMGRLREELSDQLYSFPVGHYIIFYRLVKNGVEVIRVLHGSRDIPFLFGK